MTEEQFKQIAEEYSHTIGTEYQFDGREEIAYNAFLACYNILIENYCIIKKEKVIESYDTYGYLSKNHPMLSERQNALTAAKAIEYLFGTHNLTAQAEEKPKEESNHIPDAPKIVDYTQYRLDLAKEIAVAGMTAPNVMYADIPKAAVRIANEIVKRLKETEE